MKKTTRTTTVIFGLILFLLNSAAFAADYFWVGGSGSWSDYATHWATTSGGSTFHTQAPTTSDDVYFDANSFTSTGQGIVSDGLLNFQNMDWSNVTNSPFFDWVHSTNCNGSITMSPNMSVAHNGIIYFQSSGTSSFTTAGHTFDIITIDFSAGTVNLMDNLNASSFSISNGVFNSNGNDIDLSGSFFVNYYNGSPTISMFYSSINCNEWRVEGNPGIFSATVSMGYTILTLDNTATYFKGDGQTYDAVIFSDLSSGFYVEGDNTFGSLTVEGGNAVEFTSGTTQQITSLLNLNSTSVAGISLTSSSPPNQATLNIPSSVCAEYLSIQDMEITGSTLTAGTGSTDNGNNSGITFSGTDCNPVAALTNSEDIGITAFPNPVENILTISNESGSTADISLYQIDGSEILSKTSAASFTKIDCSGLSSGLYVLQVKLGTTLHTEKIIVD